MENIIRPKIADKNITFAARLQNISTTNVITIVLFDIHERSLITCI